MPDVPNDSPAAKSPDELPHDLKLARLLGEYADLLSSGQPGVAEKFLKEHPEVATELTSETGTLGVFGNLLRGQHQGRFGDFDLILEIGRGGMGIVYEALQISLGRRVALKILPAGLLSDATAVARFRREAKVAGSLHHSHIVPVYTMGVQGGTPYFAMELCAGETLQKILARLRGGAGPDPISVGSMLLLSSRTAPKSPVNALDLEKTNSQVRSPRKVPKRRPGRAFCVEIARMFADTAEGLQHAHNLKVVHRDLKPSNLILDVDGRLRILDFSLAWIDGEQKLTLSRDRLGTPLYMSPEQARGDTHLFGPATDLYGLGATLYEVLTWQPPFEGKDLRDTLQQIVFREPVAPRRLNRAVPKDLETIVLTCLRKDPTRRYATAKDLAEDLRAFVKGRPIKAKPRPFLSRATASAWRLRKAILLCAILLGGLAFSTAAYWKWQEDNYEREVLEAVKWLMRPELRSPFTTLTRPRVESNVLDLDAGRAIRGALERRGIPVIMIAGCELVDPEAKVSSEASGEDTRRRADLEQARVHLDEAIRILPSRPEAHIYLGRTLIEEGRHREAAEALREGGHLVANSARENSISPVDAPLQKGWREAGDNFARGRWAAAARGFDAALASARASGAPFAGWELETLVKAGIANLHAQDLPKAREFLAGARQIAGDMLEIDLLYLKAHYLDASIRSVAGAEAPVTKSFTKAVGSRRETVAIQAADACIDVGEFNKAREWIECVEGPAKAELQTRLQRVMAMTGRLGDVDILKGAEEAVRRAPGDLATRLCLGNAYLANHMFKEAKEVFEQAQKLAPGDARPVVGVGICLWAERKMTDARALFEAALGLDSHYAPGHYNLGVVLDALGDEAAAESCYRSALKLDPDHALAHNNLGTVFVRRNKLQEALPEFARAVELSPLLGLAHFNHGFALQEQWKFTEAAAEYREALRLRVTDPAVRKNLGFCLCWRRDFSPAYDELKQASSMDPGCAWTQQQLGVALYQLNKLEEAVEHLEKAVKSKPLWANAHNTLGLALQGMGRTDEALSKFEEANRIDPLYVHAANDYSRLILMESGRLPQGDQLRDLMERMEVARHLAGADEAIDRLLDECRLAATPNLPTFGSIDAFLDEPEVLIADGEEWRYSPEPSSDLGWTGIDFPDGDWVPGPSGFGQPGGYGVRTAMETARRPAVLHLRHRFTIPLPARFRGVVLRVSSNTGWIAYLNGVELCRFLAGAPGASNADVEEDLFPWIAREIRVETTLKEGKNILALEVLPVPNERMDLRACPVLKAIPSFDLEAQGRAKDRLALLRSAAQGPDTEPLLAYLEAGILERLGRHAEAEQRYRLSLAGGGKRHEPILGIARCLRALGKAPEAERVLWDALDLTVAGHIPMWREWMRLSMVDLRRSPAMLLNQLEAASSEMVEPVRDDIWALGELADGRPIRINCGGPDFTEDNGKAWSRDRFSRGGYEFYLFNLSGEHHGFPAEQAFETERYFDIWDPRSLQLGYEIPLPPDKYKVTLHFAEGHLKPPDRRSFDVFLEGELRIKECEPLRAGFGIPQAEVREVLVPNGTLKVNFGRRVQNPKISAIEVERSP